MRTKNSIKNITISIGTQILMILLGFISRKVFLDNLGVQYLGINGLLTNVLSMISLVESGIGASIVYSLYKPLSENNKPKIVALIQLYKKAYLIIAIIILILSIILYPFLGNLMKDSSSIPYIGVVYFIFVAENIVGYLNAHRIALINADQKGYVLSGVNFGFQVLTTISKIIVLMLTKNYILYLLIELLFCIVQTFITGRIVGSKYAFIKTKNKFVIDNEEKHTLIKNIKALFLHNIGSYCVFGTDNILIAKFVSVSAVGIYSNYSMIIGQLSSLATPIISGIGASVGNLVATESNEKNYSIFKITYLVNFWVFSVCVIFLYNMLDPFINWWLGNRYHLDYFTFLIIILNFYLTGLRSSIGIFKTSAGIFTQDKFVPLIEAFINLGAGLILVQYLGLVGIFLGTTISTLSIVFWNVPRLVYKYVFKVSVASYFIKYLYYLSLTIIICFLTSKICNAAVVGNSLFSLFEKGFISLIVPNVIYTVLFYRTNEFRYFQNLLVILLNKAKFKIRLNSLAKEEKT